MTTLIDMTSQTFGLLKPVRIVGTDRYGAKWFCECQCGNTKIVRGVKLRNGHTISCGCAKGREPIHGHVGLRRPSRTYRSWQAMKRRCSKSKNWNYKYYGARGIAYPPSWETFEGFLKDMGERPNGTTLDRVDVNAGYSKENCRWATASQQRSNRRVTLKQHP